MKIIDQSHLFAAAAAAIKNSYSPYSRFPVGAAISTDRGIFSGCNIENASFGGTVCAERVAILKAKSEGARKFFDVLVLTPRKEAVPPCGLCLQVIAEFFSPKAKVTLASKKGVIQTLTLKELLPVSFSKKNLVTHI